VRISIIIPTLNEERYLGRLLDLLTSLEDDRLMEIWIADGGSDDRTKAVAEAYNVHWLQCRKASRAVQMNQAAAQTIGDVLYFMHADTYPPEQFLDHIEKALDGGAHVGSFAFQFDSSSAMLKFNSWFTQFNLLSVRGGDQSMFIKRNSWDLLGGYDERFVIMEEYDLLMRAKKVRLRFELMKGKMLVSDRKYHHNSYLRVNVANVVAMYMFRMGRDPRKIRSRYHSMINHPKGE
jgi:rSAM/selenodomain-associated transferase 2